MSPIQTTLSSWRNLTAQATLPKQNINTPNNQGSDRPNIQDPIGVTRLIQQSIVPNTEVNKNSFWGHDIQEKLEGHFRLGLRNVNSLPNILTT
jgi:hypothetical protein